MFKVTGRMLPNDVWYPDTYFLLVRDLIYSDEEQYIVVSQEGSVEYNRKVKLSTPCSPNVMLFPFDVVRCTLGGSISPKTVEGYNLFTCLNVKRLN